jgi:hypothetical protein
MVWWVVLAVVRLKENKKSDQHECVPFTLVMFLKETKEQ